MTDPTTGEPLVDGWLTGEDSVDPETVHDDDYPVLDDDPAELDSIAADLRAAVSGDYPADMADGYGVNEDEPERTITVAVPLTLTTAARILARERGVDQLDVYDVAMTVAVLTEASQRAIANDLGRTAEEQWREHLIRIDGGRSHGERS